ncbi:MULTISPECIES: McrC family protein [unclassified Arthrobacter]|uniref:McrC family protein n=1 Tax=unclassified Arthrobacter TaxID=235627 RepID=UPI000CE4B058|nr:MULTISPECIES: restriction endonuclease [unclassified Arthrobacter]
MRHIQIEELEDELPLVALSEAEAFGLARTGLVHVQFVGNGRWRLSPRGFVGAAEVGDVLLDVRPKDKVGVSQLLFLLGYARNAGFRPDDVAGTQTSDLWSALAESLVRQGERALGRGVLHGYVSVDDALRTVRGRIRIADQISRRPGILLPLEVTYDDHTADIAENRTLRAALRQLLGLNRVSGPVRQRLAHLERKLDGVGDLRAGTPLPLWQETRANARYVPALRLAEIILRHSVAETAVGGIRVASFVVNMAKVFEDFVEVALSEAVAKLGLPGGRMDRQYRTMLDHEAEAADQQRIHMNVDVVYRASGTPPVVFDAKYKASSGNGKHPNADHYQMLAYCTALGAPRAWLVYAGAGEHRSRRIVNTKVAVEEFPLDLSQHPHQVLERVSRLAELSVLPRAAGVGR